MKILFFDCEIVNCIPDKNQDSRYTYCAGWNDYQNMGISVIGTWSNQYKYKIFVGSKLLEFQQLIDSSDLIIGFNSLSFDDKLLQANGIKIETNYDLLCEVRVASGQPPFYTPGLTRGGYSLERLAVANFGSGKTGSGELAPKLWQDGEIEKVMDYCLNDVRLLKGLYDRRSRIVDPTSNELLCLRGGSKIVNRFARFFL